MSKHFFTAAFAAGLASLAWVGLGFLGTSWMAVVMTVVIAGVYLFGAFELRQFRAATQGLAAALADIPQPLPDLGSWLEKVPATLRNAVRLRVEGERAALPGPALTPYLAGLLVMLGMLGTFLGMVVTFKGAVFALEGSTDLHAIRAALAAPIKGLGLSFGTSVAGVAASAMLGLMSAIARRERLEAARVLDHRIASALLPFSLAHQRQETFRALQLQAGVLPDLVQRLDAMMERMERRGEQLDTQLSQQQAQFHREAALAYGELARNVGTALQDSLAAGSRAAGETLRPVVESAMTRITQDAQAMHERMGTVATSQVDALTATFEQRSTALLAAMDEGMARARAEHKAAEEQRLQAWMQSMRTMAGDLQGEWRRVGGETIARQQAVCDALEKTAGDMNSHAAEARTQMAALRQDELQRGEAAVARLGELQAAVARHLADLGAALEAPITRLLRTAAEVPQAASGVIAQLREEMSRVAERDNLALQERTTLLERFGALLQAVNTATGEQRNAIETMVASASSVLEQAGARFAGSLDAHAAKAGDMAAHVTASAVELASLAEAFGQGMQLFQAGSDKLVETLQRIEGSLQKSTARSDEQLAYYVAQAREVIDLSIASQQGLVENLRQLHAQQPAKLTVAGGTRA